MRNLPPQSTGLSAPQAQNWPVLSHPLEQQPSPHMVLVGGQPQPPERVQLLY